MHGFECCPGGVGQGFTFIWIQVMKEEEVSWMMPNFGRGSWTHDDTLHQHKEYRKNNHRERGMVSFSFLLNLRCLHDIQEEI